MGERPVLITTTRLGVRPLGVRGEPLHAVAPQLISVIRRRLGGDAADLLAEPQMRENGDGIDWYAAGDGPVRRLADASDVAEDISKDQGGYYEVSKLVATVGGRWIGVPFTVGGGLIA